jgi:hypothetical protein
MPEIEEVIIIGPSTDPNAFLGTEFLDISKFVTSMSVSLSMNSTSQLTIQVADPGLYYQSRNVFQIRRWLYFLGMQFEIAVCEVKQGSAGESVTLECRSAAIQRLKREKGKNLFTGGNATVYAATKAREQGMKFFGENSENKENISQASNTTADESVWQVIQRLASANQFVYFETDNRLFFTTQQFLLGKFAVIGQGSNPNFLSTDIQWFSEPTAKITRFTPIPKPLGRPLLSFGDGYYERDWYVWYVQRVIRERLNADIPLDGVYSFALANIIASIQTFFQVPVDPYHIDFRTWAVIDFMADLTSYTNGEYSLQAIECPNCRRSDDDFKAATVSFQIDQSQGRLLRPGMTIRIADINDFQTWYLISEVRWEEGTSKPVSVSAATVLEPDDPEKAADLRNRISYTGGGFSNIVLT